MRPLPFSSQQAFNDSYQRYREVHILTNSETRYVGSVLISSDANGRLATPVFPHGDSGDARYIVPLILRNEFGDLEAIQVLDHLVGTNDGAWAIIENPDEDTIAHGVHLDCGWQSWIVGCTCELGDGTPGSEQEDYDTCKDKCRDLGRDPEKAAVRAMPNTSTGECMLQCSCVDPEQGGGHWFPAFTEGSGLLNR